VNQGSKSATNGARRNLGRLDFSRLSSDLLLCRLIEPCLDASRPLLVKVLVGDYVVVLDHFIRIVAFITKGTLVRVCVVREGGKGRRGVSWMSFCLLRGFMH